MTEQEIRAKALEIAQRMDADAGIEDVVERAEILADWITTGSLELRGEQ
jgi:hypothetical protein